MSLASGEDARNQLKALLEGIKPRESAPPRRSSKPHPLYGSSGSGSSSSKRRGSQASSTSRSTSQPSSPKGVSKARLPRSGASARTAGAASRGASRRGPPLGTASAPSSPVDQRHQGAHGRVQLDFGGEQLQAAFSGRATSAPSSPAPPHRQWGHSPPQSPSALPQQRLPWDQHSQPEPAGSSGASSQVLDFARLRITSPAGSPNSSPSRPLFPAAALPAAAAAAQSSLQASLPQAAPTQQGSQPVISQWRLQLQRQQSPAGSRRHFLDRFAPSQQQAVPDSPDLPLLPPGSPDENWFSCTASPQEQQYRSDEDGICCNQEGVLAAAGREAAAASCGGSPIPLSPEFCAWSQGQEQSQHEWQQQQQAAAPSPPGVASWQHSEQQQQQAALSSPPAAAPPHHLPRGAPPSPFNSSQERRQEIALLSEMAQQMGAGAWSYQEEEQALPCQQQQQQQQYVVQEHRRWAATQESHHHQQQEPNATGMPPAGGTSPLAAAAGTEVQATSVCCSQGGASQGSGSAGRRPYICSLTSQELSELADPWSQPVQQQQQQQAGQPPPPQQQDADNNLPALAAGPSGAADAQAAQQALRAQYPQQGAGLNQWAAVGRPAQRGASHPLAAHQQLAGWQQQHRQQADGQQSPRSLEEQRRCWELRQQREQAENQLVAATCSLPQLTDFKETFSTQREAFACADYHNRHMPPLRQRQTAPAVVMSRVPQSELLPTSGAGAGYPAGGGAAAARSGSGWQVQQSFACAASSSSGGGGGSGAAHSSSVPGGQQQQGGSRIDTGQEAQSAGRLPAGGQGAAGAGTGAAPDFLSRFQAGALPGATSAGYSMPSPLLKRQRAEQSEQEAQRQQHQQQQQAAREQYEAALRALQSGTAAQPAQQQQQQQQAAGSNEQQAEANSGEGNSADQAQNANLGAAAPAQLAAAAGMGDDWREEAVRTFCVERRSRSGTYYRSFTVASYPAVWSLFRRTRCEERHWYEVIREGRPAHLYFDIEFPRQLNPQVDGDALVDRLLHHVAEQLRRHFNLGLDLRCCYELDSSTPAKFSRHLTVRLPGHAFATNHAMGKFVAQVLAASGSELLVVRSEQDGVPQLGSVVDMAVYSKNRHWRMSYCCKGGKSAVLMPTARYATAEGATTSVAWVFLDTLVCNVDPRARLLQMPDPLPMLGSGPGLGRGPLASAAVLAGPGMGTGTAGGGLRVAWKQDACDDAMPPEQLEELKRLAERALPFIERVATQRAGGALARVRTLAFCGAGGTVAYSMIGPGSHYCENIGRPHASNHVFFVADFRGGSYAQKCYDPDCARYRSGWMPLPPELCLPEALRGALPPPSPQSSSRHSGRSRG